MKKTIILLFMCLMKMLWLIVIGPEDVCLPKQNGSLLPVEANKIQSTLRAVSANASALSAVPRRAT